MAPRPKKNFVLLNSDNSDSTMVFASAQPRGAALKAASRGKTDIRLRERGTNRVHVFTGSVDVVDAPANRPSWLPARVKKANVKKVGVERI